MVEGNKTTTAQLHSTIKSTQQTKKEGNKRGGIPVMDEMLCAKKITAQVTVPLLPSEPLLSLTTSKNLGKRK